MFKVLHQVYTAEFKEAAGQRVKDGQSVSAVARELGMSMQTLRNWLKASETASSMALGSGQHVVNQFNPMPNWSLRRSCKMGNASDVSRNNQFRFRRLEGSHLVIS
ncbi:hypothetical protein R69888_04974 [Paraburkholderia haematera]|uniref:Transposase n=1 Tax=Paraburkholderia haematera TaxID=2793077 RepID=A0ABN7MGD1_9BURK|nr:hypothetical protein R69888_04974 [Paraburkholderia haematera]